MKMKKKKTTGTRLPLGGKSVDCIDFYLPASLCPHSSLSTNPCLVYTCTEAFLLYMCIHFFFFIRKRRRLHPASFHRWSTTSSHHYYTTTTTNINWMLVHLLLLTLWPCTYLYVHIQTLFPQGNSRFWIEKKPEKSDLYPQPLLSSIIVLFFLFQYSNKPHECAFMYVCLDFQPSQSELWRVPPFFFFSLNWNVTNEIGPLVKYR